MQKVLVGQDTSWSGDCPGEGRVDQAVPLNMAMLPVADTTTQKVGVAHERVCTGRAAVPTSTTASRPQTVPSNRLATPAVLTDAQKEVDTQETWYWPPVGPVGAGPTATAADHVRASKVTASWLLRATQKVGDEQDTELIVPSGEAGLGLDQVRPFHTMALPPPSTAAQKLGVGHDTPLTAEVPAACPDGCGWTAGDQVPADGPEAVEPPQEARMSAATPRATAAIAAGGGRSCPSRAGLPVRMLPSSTCR
jgi:hypothetical protein